MKLLMLRVIYLFAIWLLFIAGAVVCFFAPIAAVLLAIIRPSLQPVRIVEIIRSMDRLNAALLGFGGQYTISAACAADDCKFCKRLCKLLSFAEPDHCKKSAAKEGYRS
jgi:hypothetical protein